MERTRKTSNGRRCTVYDLGLKVHHTICVPLRKGYNFWKISCFYKLFKRNHPLMIIRFSWLKRLLGEPLSSREIFGGKQDKYTAKRSHSLGNALSVRRIPSLGLEPLEPRHLFSSNVLHSSSFGKIWYTLFCFVGSFCSLR